MELDKLQAAMPNDRLLIVPHQGVLHKVTAKRSGTHHHLLEELNNADGVTDLVVDLRWFAFCGFVIQMCWKVKARTGIEAHNDRSDNRHAIDFVHAPTPNITRWSNQQSRMVGMWNGIFDLTDEKSKCRSLGKKNHFNAPQEMRGNVLIHLCVRSKRSKVLFVDALTTPNKVPPVPNECHPGIAKGKVRLALFPRKHAAIASMTVQVAFVVHSTQSISCLSFSLTDSPKAVLFTGKITQIVGMHCWQ